MPRHFIAAEERVEGFAAFVLERAGLAPDAYRAAPLRRRTAVCLRAVRASSESAARAGLEHDLTLRRTALNTLLIGVSSFFRDAEVFETLKRTVIPRLSNRAGKIRVLSLGCSSGAELYSVALLLTEADVLDRAELVGVDCRADAVATARLGWIDDSSAESIPPGLLTRCFEATSDGRHIVKALRERISWQLDDATRRLPDGPWDLVLCRNLLMYLRADLTAAMCQRVVSALRPGGVFVLGKAERPAASLGLAPLARCVYLRHEA
jgi:chemotaxis methyl-accepting protein methylase